MRKATFYMDAIPDQEFNGYTDGDDWNGFATPRFEREVAERVLRASEQNGYTWSYDADKDIFTIHWEEDAEGENDWYGADPIEVDGETKHVYAIGAYNWTWSEIID